MRNKWRWLVLGIIVLLAIAEYGGLSTALGTRLTSLANQPDVSTAFDDPESGRTDALTALIAFAVLAPIGALAGILALVLVTKLFESIIVSVHLPAWLSTPAVGIGTIAAIYATSQAWIPVSLHGLGLIARAYLVYAYGDVPVIR